MRRGGRIDYKLLHNKGQIVQKVENFENVKDAEIVDPVENANVKGATPKTMDNKLIIEVRLVHEAITDYIDESRDDPSKMVAKLEDLRHTFRGAHHALRLQIGSDEYQAQNFEKERVEMNNFLKDKLNELRDKEEEVKQKDAISQKASMEKGLVFIAGEFERTISELEMFFLPTVSIAKDHEVTQWNEELPHHVKRFDTLAERYKAILQSPSPNPDFELKVTKLGTRYEELASRKRVFVSTLRKEIMSRELGKQDLVKEARLNINLPKFSGYESDLDIYSFQIEFEKLHTRTYPRRSLPDVLLNNFLSEPALSLVKGLDNIDEIWQRLKSSYGDTRMLLSRKLNQLDHVESSGKSKEEKLVTKYSRLICVMKDLLKLASKHNIEKNLFYGGATERIYKVMGDGLVNKWLDLMCDESPIEKELWNKLITFLERQIKIQQQKMLVTPKPEEKDKDDSKKKHRGFFTDQDSDQPICFICGKSSNHITTNGPGKTRIIQYFACKIFTEKTPSERLRLLREKGYCIQCLYPGADSSKGKHKKGKCQKEFVCPNASHDRYQTQKHVLLCEEHKYDPENENVLVLFKSRYISRNTSLPEFSQNIKLAFVANTTLHAKANPRKGRRTNKCEAINDRGVYMLQTITVNSQPFTIFFDTGCSDFILTRDAADRMGDYATAESSDPITITGVGDKSVQTSGSYKVRLPLCNGTTAILRGICLEKITTPFPVYDLAKAEYDLRKAAADKADRLPKLPSSVGGKIDMMIGIQYLKYHPQIIFQIHSGLTIYESVFKGSDGSRGVIGGPHPSFSLAKNFFSNEVNHFRNSSSLSDDKEPPNHSMFLSNPLKPFTEAECVGSEISYRCPSCRECKSCKNHDTIEAISIRQDAEQAIIDTSVQVDLVNKVTTARLPFICNPIEKLLPNKSIAMKVYQQQLKKLNNLANVKDKADIIESEMKLQKLGFVDYTKNLPPDIQELLRQQPIQNFIPWRAVWKPSSVSTPCRIVFDASQNTPSGQSLNDVLAKGRNSLNHLQEILIRWSIHKVAIHSDVRKMYNTIKLDVKDWCFQRYIWQENLDPTQIPEEKVIKTLIYGVKPSGNQAEFALREVAKLKSHEYPEVSDILHKDVYVDDCITGEESMKQAIVRSQQIEHVVNQGGFQLKGITLSGTTPDESLSDDTESIVVAGFRWLPKEDLLSLNLGNLNFAKKKRGKKPDQADNVIPTVLTRRHCTSKVGEVYDILGKVTPLTAAMKIDLHDLVTRGLNWDDQIPNDLKALWINHFEMIQEIKHLYFKRTIIPEDAESLAISTIDTADASPSLACVAIYARIKRKNGDFSCQLVLGRSRIVHDRMTQPRAELFAAVLNAHSGEVVRRSFHKWHTSALKLSDSQIALYWLSNDDKPLKQWVRNRSIEIRRFAQPSQWHYVSSNNMPADIGTRKGATLEDVQQSSTWIQGLDWMTKDSSEFPMKSINQLKLSTEEMTEARKETALNQESFLSIKRKLVPSEVADRYAFSGYLVDPNSHPFHIVVKIMSYVLKFVSNCRRKLKYRPDTVPVVVHIPLTDEELKDGSDYFFRKCTGEIKQFLPKTKYDHISKEVDGILIYSGRILSSTEVTCTGKFTNAMKDLTSTTFCVPLVDKSSPVAYSIINDVHWNHTSVMHCGVETTWRHVLKIAYIIEGRSLVKTIRKSCERCRYLVKKTIAVEMGPVSKHNLMIAPAFYVTQVDLSGPYRAYSPHNKRSTIKVWLVIFCCCTTSTVSIRCMEDYGTSAFLQAFIRLASEVGFSKTLLCDEGSQLVKGCDDMKISFTDLTNKLYRDVNVNFEVCPVGGHNMHGKVERMIKEVNVSISKIASNERLSLMQWETIGAKIANSINNLPLALGSITSDFEKLDLITPNRLKLGRNNERSPVGKMILTGNPDKILTENARIFDSWFENWLQNHVPRLMDQPKWFTTDEINKGDIVLFLKNESKLSSTYQFGVIEAVQPTDRDGIVRKVDVRYRNHNENAYRVTRRAVRSLVKIKSIDEGDIVTELGRMACVANKI